MQPPCENNPVPSLSTWTEYHAAARDAFQVLYSDRITHDRDRLPNVALLARQAFDCADALAAEALRRHSRDSKPATRRYLPLTTPALVDYMERRPHEFVDDGLPIVQADALLLIKSLAKRSECETPALAINVVTAMDRKQIIETTGCDADLVNITRNKAIDILGAYTAPA